MQLPPGAFISSTRPAATGSETAQKITGISVFAVAANAETAAGVAIANIISYCFAAMFFAMASQVALSKLPSCLSIVSSRSDSVSACSIPEKQLSSEGWLPYWITPIL